ncbi:MAG: mechanosensitive ion channel [Bacteroidales bacterium]|nr:mechanosensitive ion channel [Bacteroidales bacterium]MDD4217489.1 mechanosensitive ion channel [Bacteroidales bacterium]MDY0143030.1 mechanosensitive ion channel [Bacteroidales bacterium]
MMNENLYNAVFDLLLKWGVSIDASKILASVSIIIIILLISVIVNYVFKKIILVVIKKIIKKSKTTWDDVLFEKKVFDKLSQLAPIFFIYYTIGLALPSNIGLVVIIQKLLMTYMVFVFVMILNSFFNSINQIYDQTVGQKKGASIKSYIQVVKIIIFIIAAIVALSILSNKEVGYFVTGLGAISAVLLLIFKDSILGLVGGIQLTSNDMVRIGDWISMPSRSADGNVIEVSLNTVKVQNWDKTISTIPTYALVNESFSNWRGMEESGGRRIKRSLILDMKSVKFCSPELIEKLSNYKVINEYLTSKTKEIEEHNSKLNDKSNIAYNGRQLTNIGVFRKYIEEYLKNNESMNQNMTLIVRQLAPTPEGIPMEIYGFSRIQAWALFEGVQSDIFDHLLAVISDFELSVFQSPSGADFRILANS